MRRNTLTVCLVGAVLLSNGLAQSVISDSDVIEYNRRVAQNHKTVFPTAGVIPDAETAKSVAQAIAIPIWGKKTVDSELPLLAELKGNVWTVVGNPHFERAKLGGELIIQFDKRNGAVLSSCIRNSFDSALRVPPLPRLWGAGMDASPPQNIPQSVEIFCR